MKLSLRLFSVFRAFRGKDSYREFCFLSRHFDVDGRRAKKDRNGSRARYVAAFNEEDCQFRDWRLSCVYGARRNVSAVLLNFGDRFM